jgi:hypothetical protein
MVKRNMFVGMDVHKESIDISLAAEGRIGEVRHDGGIPADLEALAKVVKALRFWARRLDGPVPPLARPRDEATHAVANEDLRQPHYATLTSRTKFSRFDGAEFNYSWQSPTCPAWGDGVVVFAS